MKNISLFVTLFAVLASQAFAQKITGTVMQKDGNPLEFATITLNKASDSSLLMGAISGQDGSFAFNNIKPGKYYVSANMIGMDKVKSPEFNVKNEEITLDPLSLTELSTELSQVTITAKRPALEVRADKTIMNVEGNISTAGLNALELLRKAPGVTVDNNDNISIKGKNGVKFYIDGREVPLDSKDVAMQLKSMQAAEIGNIEIITNPSARYDAAGNAGIINIRMKKNRNYGTNGNAAFEYIQGETPKGGVNLSLNHREEDFNVFGSYNNHYGKWHQDQDFYRIQNGRIFDQPSSSYYLSRWNDARLGIDYSLDSKSTFGFLVSGNANPYEWASSSRTSISDTEDPATTDSILLADNTIESKRNNLNLNLNYGYADTSGTTFSVDFNKAWYRLDGNSMLYNDYTTPDGQMILNNYTYHTLTPTEISLLSLKGDYERKIWKGSLSGGIKFSDVTTDNTYTQYNVYPTGEVLNENVSNTFVYDESIVAAYLNYQAVLGKWTVQAGLRAENTDYDGELTTHNEQNNETISDNYLEFFPSAAITWMFATKFGLNATYSRRIDRPSYQDLNPFEFKIDEMTYEKGNPLLKPQFTNSYELSGIILGHPVLTLGYSQTTDVIARIIDTTGGNASYITQENLANQDNVSLSLNIPTPVAKWWDGMISLSGYIRHIKAELRPGFNIDEQFSAVNIYAEQMFKLPYGINLQLSGWYNSPAVSGTLQMESQGAVDLSLQKRILQDKGDVKLRFGDIFNTANWSATNLYTPGLEMTAHGNWESRTVTLNFSYRFGSNDVKSSRQRRTGLEDESRRVKSSRN